MNPNQEQPTQAVEPEYMPPVEIHQSAQPVQTPPLGQPQQPAQAQPLAQVPPSSRYDVSRRTARLAVALLVVTASMTILTILAMISGYAYYFVGLLALATIVIILAFIIVRRAYLSLAMYGAAIAIYAISSTVDNYDFVSTMSQLIPYIIGPLFLAATGLLLVDAYRIIRAQSAVTIRSRSVRIGLLVAAIVGSAISIGAVVFVLSMSLALRACELSGSSKCM